MSCLEEASSPTPSTVMSTLLSDSLAVFGELEVNSINFSEDTMYPAKEDNYFLKYLRRADSVLSQELLTDLHELESWSRRITEGVSLISWNIVSMNVDWRAVLKI